MKKIFFFTGLLFVLLACSKDKSVADPNSDNISAKAKAGKDPSSFQNIIHITNSSFSPAYLEVNIGATVTWINDDVEATHTVSGEKFESGDIPPGGSFKASFDNTGTFNYFCKYHSEKAVLVVAGIR